MTFASLPLNLKDVDSVGIIGTGKIGRAIAFGLRASNDKSQLRILCSDHQESALQELKSDRSIECFVDNERVARDSAVLILAVKPYQARKVLESLRPHLRSHQILISICASITLEQLSEWTDGVPKIVRAMPNLPVVVNRGITVLSPGSGCRADDLRLATKVFASVGHVIELEEKYLDAVTALSGSGPAFMFFFIEALSEAGARLGIPKQQAFELVFHTMRGSAELCLEKSIDPGELIQQVATPGGCTIEGLKVFDEMDLRKILVRCIERTAHRASQLRLES